MTSDLNSVLQKHWVLESVNFDDLDRAQNLVHQQLAIEALEKQIDFSYEVSPEDKKLLREMDFVYELVAIDGLDELSRPSGENHELREQVTAASYRLFDIRRLLPIPKQTLDRLFFVLQLSSIAYCGDRWSDLRRWYGKHEKAIESPDVADVEWDTRLLYRLFECWVSLFRKKGWDDLNRISAIISDLRRDQSKYEKDCLNNGSDSVDRSIALRLIALYHWAKSTETLALFMLQGEPIDPFGILDKHFEASIKAASVSRDVQLTLILQWLHSTARIMVTNSLWWATRSVNSKTSKFVHSLTRREHQPMFELLPPQRTALLEQGLLDQAKTAIVIDLPTSGGKTLLAQFRILQALNQFQNDEEKGWVAYVAPTRALTAQITRRLRSQFEPIGVIVEQLTAAVDVDAFEEQLLTDQEKPFDILVATPEKLAMVTRNRKVHRSLALVVMDEAHNLETPNRGLRIELLLASIKWANPNANFLLLMPYVDDTEPLARWLARDHNAGRSISLGTGPWKPNERIIGLYRAVSNDSKRGGWHIEFESLTTTKKALPLKGTYQVGGVRVIDVPKSKVLSRCVQKGLYLQTAAITKEMSSRGTSVAVANQIKSVWNMADEAANSLPRLKSQSDEVRLVQDFLRTEVSRDFKLIELLDKGVGVHHAGLSDEVRTLIEWLAEEGQLQMLCATSTIAQGLNFPVSSVFLSSLHVPDKKFSFRMNPREFWNLAGRTGRIDHDSVGVIGIAEGKNRNEIIEFLSTSTGALVSRLVDLLNDLAKQGKLNQLSDVFWQSQWDDFRCYITHLWSEKQDLEVTLTDTEQLLRQTLGYTTMRNNPQQREQANALLEATKKYVSELAGKPKSTVKFSELTGFSPEGVEQAISGIRRLDKKLSIDDLIPESLFGKTSRMAELFDVMLKVPQLNQQLSEFQLNQKKTSTTSLSEITKDWVNGTSLEAIAAKYFIVPGKDPSNTEALTEATKSIYRTIVNYGTWGISALSHVSGIDFKNLEDTQKRQINTLPAMIYHGVNTAGAVLMRMNSVPRCVATDLGNLYQEYKGKESDRFSVSEARQFLVELSERDWEKVRPPKAALSGSGFKSVWEVLSGKSSEIFE